MTTLKLDSPVAEGRARVVLRSTSFRSVDLEKRVIRGLSAITRGEALGHEMWIDEQFLEQLTAAGNALERGAKSRFTHPDMSSDGLGKFLGRAKAFERDGNQVRADLELAAVASKSPQGDLATYVLEFADEDPHAFGASIVFMRDMAAEDEFARAHSGNKGFASPDPENKRHLRHARLKELLAVDLVDEPAANPGGAFSHPTFDLLEGSDAAAAFLLGLSDKAPPSFGGIDPSRARAFVARFLDQRGLRVGPKETVMNNGKDSTSAGSLVPVNLTTGPTAATVVELKKEFSERPAFVLEQLEKGATLEQARAAFRDLRISELEGENEKLRAQAAAPVPPAPKALAAAGTVTTLASAKPGRGVPPVGFSAPADRVEGGQSDILELARAYRDEKHPELAGDPLGRGMAEALKVVTKQHPEAYATWRGSQRIPNLARPAR